MRACVRACVRTHARARVFCCAVAVAGAGARGGRLARVEEAVDHHGPRVGVPRRGLVPPQQHLRVGAVGELGGGGGDGGAGGGWEGKEVLGGLRMQAGPPHTYPAPKQHLHGGSGGWHGGWRREVGRRGKEKWGRMQRVWAGCGRLWAWWG